MHFYKGEKDETFALPHDLDQANFMLDRVIDYLKVTYSLE